jgi:hypothetical protein
MACPNCGCKVTYPYEGSDYLEKCAYCDLIFDVDTALDDDDEFD